MFATVAFASSFLPSHRLPNQFRLAAPIRPHRTSVAHRVVCSDADNLPGLPGLARPVVPSPTLIEFHLEDKVQSRGTVLKQLSSYVKENNLQDDNDKRLIRCDDKLKQLFGVEQCTFIEMSKYVVPHLRKPEDLGGRYLEEARSFEAEYRAKKMKEKEEKGPSTGKGAKRRRKQESTKDPKQRYPAVYRPVTLSPELSAICRNRKEMLRSEVLKAVWDYIHLNNLYEAPGKPIRCDFLLKKIFNTDTVDSKTIMKGISQHMTKTS